MPKEKLIKFFQSSNLVNLQKAEEISSHFLNKVIDRNEFFLKEGKLSDEFFLLKMGLCVHLPLTLTEMMLQQISIPVTRLFLKYPRFLIEQNQEKIYRR